MTNNTSSPLQLSFLKNIENMWQEKKFLCIGLDLDYEKFPQSIKTQNITQDFFSFNKAIIDATHDLVCAYKPQIAHYSAEGNEGLDALRQTIKYIKKTYPEILVILDAKRGDIGSTAKAYVREVFDVLHADAVTVNPYLGFDSIEPFLERKEKGVIVLCRTSNPGASDFQDLIVSKKPLYMHVAEKVVAWNKTYGNCLLVVGATAPEQMAAIRNAAPDIPFLIPGVGAQGGTITDILKNGLRKDKTGVIIAVSRSVIYASNQTDFAEKARGKALEYTDQIRNTL